jgi:hypothetical protein
MTLAKRGKVRPKIRKVAGLTAIEESIGRCTEMGRPIHYAVGRSPLTGANAAETIAGLSLLGHVSKLAARYGVSLIFTNQLPEVQPLGEDIVRQGFVAAGKGHLYDPRNVRFLSSYAMAYTSGAIGIMDREKIAANFMLGGWYAESLILAEAGFNQGAIQVAGTTQFAQLPFFVTVCDYVLIGEELLAAAAYVSDDPVQLSSLVGQDFMKLIAIFLILVGALLSTVGVADLYNLFRL